MAIDFEERVWSFVLKEEGSTDPREKEFV